MLLERGPREWLVLRPADRRMAVAIAGNLWHFGVGLICPGALVRTPPQEQGRFGARVAAEQAREFEAGIAGRAQNGGFDLGPHLRLASAPLDPSASSFPC